MTRRIMILLFLIIAAGASAWMLNMLTKAAPKPHAGIPDDPDFYMEDFTTTSMNEDGTPKNRLYAVYMAHFPDKDMSELQQPRLEMFRDGKLPVYVTAKNAWVTSNNELVLLSGDVVLWEDDALGNRILQITTSTARVFLDKDYAETDKYAKIVSKRSTITGIGMRTYLDEDRLEVLNDVHTTIEPRQIESPQIEPRQTD